MRFLLRLLWVEIIIFQFIFYSYGFGLVNFCYFSPGLDWFFFIYVKNVRDLVVLKINKKFLSVFLNRIFPPYFFIAKINQCSY